MKKKLIGILMSAVLAASVFAGCGGSGDSDTIKIGTLGPYSGDNAMYGLGARNGMELAVEEINENGGIDGKKIELVSNDTKGDSTEAVNAYNRMRDQDGVVAIVGPVLSGEALAIKDLTVSDNMPILTPTGTADDITIDAPNSFRVCYLDAYQGNAGANFAVGTEEGELGAKTAAILVNKGNAYSEGLAAAFTKTFEEKGGKVLSTESYAQNDKDFSAQLTKIKDLNPEVIYIPDYYSVAGPILKKAKEMGISAKFVGGDGWDSVQVDYADAAQGHYFANHYAADSPDEKVQNFMSAYTNKYDETPNSFAALGYDAVYCMADAIKTAGSTDAQAIIDALQASDFTGVTGHFTFDENGNPKGKEITIITVDGGELKFVTKVKGDN